MLFASGVAVFAFVILVSFFRADYRRLTAEQRTQAEKILNTNDEIPVPT